MDTAAMTDLWGITGPVVIDSNGVHFGGTLQGNQIMDGIQICPSVGSKGLQLSSIEVEP